MTIAATEWYAPSAVAPVLRREVRSAHRTVGTLLWAILIPFAAESVLRARAWHLNGSDTPVANIYEPDSELGRRLRPGATLNGSRRQVSINSLGFRGPEIPKDKPAGTVRIVALGDSTTFGMEASGDQAVWVERMVGRLRDSSFGKGFDAINAGVPGYTLAVSAEQLIRYIAPVDPDVVIVNQVTTDIAAHGRRQFRANAATSEPPSVLTKFLEENSLLVNVVRQNTTALTRKYIPRRRFDRLDDRGVAEYAERLGNLLEICRERGWRMILCTCPRSFGDASATADQYGPAATALANNPALSLIGLNDAFDRYNEAIRQVARRLGAPLVDLDRLVPKRAECFVDAVHLNDAGHDLVGGLIADVVAIQLLNSELPQGHQ